MRRFLVIVLLLALMGGFAFGVNRFFALRKANVAAATTPTSARPAFVLPGTLYIAQQGTIYRLNNGSFTDLHLPKIGTWMQPAVVPGTSNFVAVLRTAAYSEVYLIDSGGHILNKLSQNATTSSTIQLNHWMFWPHVGLDGQTFYVSYDAPKSTGSYEIEFAVWAGALTGKLTSKQWTDPYGYTGGDVGGIPMLNGGLLYSKYQISNGQVYSRLAIEPRAWANPVYLTDAESDCGEPALSPDNATIAMVCTGGTGLQSTRLVVATLTGTKLGPQHVLLDNCLCASPAWAANGSGISYFAPVDATGHFQLWWIANAAGVKATAPKQVTEGLDFDATSPPAWSLT
jgi:hypothetical protein